MANTEFVFPDEAEVTAVEKDTADKKLKLKLLTIPPSKTVAASHWNVK